MAKNNIQRLKEDADIEKVISALGIPYKGRGSAKFIHCPLPKHDDKHATNCYFRSGWNNVYCTVCGKSIQAIDLIMYTTGVTYGAAADMLWEISDRPAWYYAKGKKEKKSEFTITCAEANVIDLLLPTKTERMVRYSHYKEVAEQLPKNQMYAAYTEADGYGFLVVERETVSWRDFISEQDMKQLVMSRCKRKEASFKFIEERFRAYGFAEDLFLEQRKIIEKLKKRCLA